MKRIAHRINVIILTILAILSIAMIVVKTKSVSPVESEDALIWISAIFQLVMVLIMTVTGILFPEKDTYLNKKQSIIANIALLLNSILNKSVVSSSQIEVANGEKAIHKGWEPAVGFIWLFFQAILGVITIVSNPRSSIATIQIISLALIILFIIVSYIWKIEDNKQKYGKPIAFKSLLPMFIAIIIFSIGIVGGIIKTKLESKNDFDLVQIKEDIKKAKDFAAKDYRDIEINIEDYLSEEEVVSLIKNSMDTKEDIYYKIQSSKDNSNEITFIVWTSNDENVYWFKFIKYDEGYLYHSSMKSNAISKEDVEGKQDGIL